MGINNIVRKRGFRNFMAKLYGWGASVVILGALFKINHYTGADIMLVAGLGTEALIFFFSAFEPPHVEPDWSVVYPELAGLYHETDDEESLGGKGSATEQLDNMLTEAKIGPDLIASLGKGLTNLSENTSKLSDISDAAIATNSYVENINNASQSAGELTESYKLTAESLKRDAGASEEYINNVKEASGSASGLSKAYNDATELIRKDLSATEEFAGSIKEASESAKVLALNYTKSAEILGSSINALDFSAVDGNAYNEQIGKISDNLAALNSVYELQLQSTNQQVESSAKLQETMNEFLTNLGESVNKTANFQNQMDVLTNNVVALNKVYGNMLSAMNVNTNS
ncbi:MAG: gliding motility protein GldL [Bacteroidales bacterium]|nr:gliding motility protein GldL [Bacteroidales bacterium]